MSSFHPADHTSHTQRLLRPISPLLAARECFVIFYPPSLPKVRTELYASPFDGTGTTCYLAQFFNAIYVLNGDAQNPNNIYIFDATTKTWSTQVTTPGQFDFSSFDAILDHDTNVFCT